MLCSARDRSLSSLPEGWSAPEIFEDTICADGVELRRAGVSCVAPSGEEITGAAASAEESPSPRASFELLERAATMEALATPRPSCVARSLDGRALGVRPWSAVFPESDAPASWRYARSNGVALHTSWHEAATRAYFELVERDRVLRAWHGETRPVQVAFEVEGTPLARASSYEISAYEFPRAESRSFGAGAHVAAVIGFPRGEAEEKGAPLVMGFGARDSWSLALRGATCEALQSLAFLWGEALPERAPDPGPTAMHHMDHFQWPPNRAVLRAWLGGAHFVSSRRRRVGGPNEGALAFVDLTPEWLRGRYVVVKAVCDSAMALAFGEAPATSTLPKGRKLHPIA